jgi:hypothetical protein
MIIRIERGKPVNAVVEFNSDRVVQSGPFGRGGRVVIDDGDVHVFNGVEWAQWVEQSSWVE